VTVSTHVLDTAAGRPAASVAVRLEREENGGWRLVGQGTTDPDGRLAALAPSDVALPAGTYRLTFEIGAYFSSRQFETFYRRDVAAHYHVPLLVSPYGYTTYRGS
jgi:5-hydroxyisourate hydrolase